ncbi:hypothetical protein FGO68_gene7176 [Halteria grandinella]|uniref:Uncharacterized protein n=1 Tax=Halteria grandinella TaxID=5974 RepID=A0A8J8TAY4_HALGN|nr:hypothetical protein FGO68_gene7176 [Halteria grandinella]
MLYPQSRPLKNVYVALKLSKLDTFQCQVLFKRTWPCLVSPSLYGTLGINPGVFHLERLGARRHFDACIRGMLCAGVLHWRRQGDCDSWEVGALLLLRWIWLVLRLYQRAP